MRNLQPWLWGLMLVLALGGCGRKTALTLPAAHPAKPAVVAPTQSAAIAVPDQDGAKS